MNFTPKNPTCECGKKYADNSGLWRHRKKCSFIEKEVDFTKTEEMKNV